MAGGDEGFVGLDVDDGVGLDGLVGDGEAVGAAGEGGVGEDGAEAVVLEDFLEFGSVDGEPGVKLGGLLAEAEGRPEDEGPAAHGEEEFAGEADRGQAGGDNDGGAHVVDN